MKTIINVLLIFLVQNLMAQSPEALIEQSMNRLGPWQEVLTLHHITKGESYNKWQNYDFFNPTANKNEVYRVFDFKNNNYYYKTVQQYGGGYKFEFTTIGKDTTRYSYDVNQSRNGKTITKAGKQLYESGYNILNQTLPYYLLKSVMNSKDSLTIINSSNDLAFRRHLKNGSTEDYFFDINTSYLKKMSSTASGQIVERYFQDYITEQNLYFPKLVSVYLDNELLNIDRTVELKIDDKFNSNLLQLPEDYTIVPVNAPAAPIVSEIAKDVFLIEKVPGGRNMMFVNMDEFIFVTEAPLNSAVSQSMIDLINKTIPDKPIKYVHISHFHNDHSNGIRSFIAEGAALIATPHTIIPLETIIFDSTGRFNDRLSKERKKPKIESFSGIKVLKDKNHEIQLHEIKTTHAKGMSFVYLPKEKILYQGDLYTLPDDGTITPAIEVTRNFHAYLKKKNIKPNRIIGHHGHSDISFEILEKAVSLKTQKKP